MVAHRIVPQNPAERLIWYSLLSTWALYAAGALYVLGPALAMFLLALLAWGRFSSLWTPPALRPHPIPLGIWIWGAGMAGMLTALLYVHLSEHFGLGPTLKSSVGWVKGWALMALFPAMGACLRIRPELVVRGMNHVAVQTLILMPFLVGAAFAHLPSQIYVSPISAVGGPGPEFFTVYLYIVDPSNGALRWQFMAPWAPAAGMIGNVMLILSRHDASFRFRWAGTVCGILMCLMTGSRMSVLFALIYLPLIWMLSRISQSWMLLCLSGVATTAGILAGTLLDLIGNATASFRAARANSTRVRETLGRIAVQRWWEEAPVWGHGTVSASTHFVEFMPIGSHHTWYGLLYVKGIAGCISLVIPLCWTIIEMLLLAQVSRLGQLGLSVAFLILFYSFGENLEILAYLMWPALIILGCAFGEAHGMAPAAGENECMQPDLSQALPTRP